MQHISTYRTASVIQIHYRYGIRLPYLDWGAETRPISAGISVHVGPSLGRPAKSVPFKSHGSSWSCSGNTSRAAFQVGGGLRGGTGMGVGQGAAFLVEGFLRAGCAQMGGSRWRVGMQKDGRRAGLRVRPVRMMAVTRAFAVPLPACLTLLPDCWPDPLPSLPPSHDTPSPLPLPPPQACLPGRKQMDALVFCRQVLAQHLVNHAAFSKEQLGDAK